jgi:pimeloyl-ACP methyl ester carboxylesterase
MVRALMRRLGAEAWVIRRALGTMIAGGDLLDGKLGAISAPTLIVWGKEDALIPLRCGLEMRREIPQSRLLIFDGCGHMLPIESSARLASETLRFLD